jgi:hypothetical protein
VDALSRFPLPSTEDRTGARLDHDSNTLVVAMARNLLHSLLKQPQATYLNPMTVVGSPDAHGVRLVAKLDTRPLSDAWAKTPQSGIVLYEPFGGLCAGLEAMLRNGIKVHHYY